MNKEYYTVSELNQHIKSVLNEGFPYLVWVTGEVQGFNRNRHKSHVFFELVEKQKGSNDVLGRIGLVVFSSRRDYIQNILKQSENAFELKDDIEVKFACRVDFYPPHGAVRLIVESIDPTFTLGKIAQERQKLIALLKEKGILDQNKQLELSRVPLNIGLITSDDSAAYNDFIAELNQSGFAFKVYLRNATMQGAKTEKDVCEAIEELQKIKDIDCIAITRGGGSIADLSWFDSEQISLTVAKSKIPILSAIGHEINTTITDLAAHTFLKTPTALAQFLVERVDEFLGGCDDCLSRIIESADEQIQAERERLKGNAITLQQSTFEMFKETNEFLIRSQEFLKNTPVYILKNREKNIQGISDDLLKSSERGLIRAKNRLKGHAKMIDMVDPINTIKRGFSVTRTDDGKLVRKVKDVKSRNKIKTELVDGVVESNAV